MASSSSSAIELPKLKWLEEKQELTNLGKDDDKSWTDRFWAQPELVRGEAAIAASIGVKWRHRGPLGPKEGGPSTWRQQEYREGSARWGNRGKASNEKFWKKIRAKRDAKKAKKARTGYSQDDGHQQGDQEVQKEGEREHDDGTKDGDQEHNEEEEIVAPRTESGDEREAWRISVANDPSEDLSPDGDGGQHDDIGGACWQASDDLVGMQAYQDDGEGWKASGDIVGDTKEEGDTQAYLDDGEETSEEIVAKPTESDDEREAWAKAVANDPSEDLSPDGGQHDDTGGAYLEASGDMQAYEDEGRYVVAAWNETGDMHARRMHRVKRMRRTRKVRVQDVNESEGVQAGYQADGGGEASEDIVEDPSEAADWKACVEDGEESGEVQARLERVLRYADARIDRLATRHASDAA